MRKAPIEGNEKDLYRPIILQDMKSLHLQMEQLLNKLMDLRILRSFKVRTTPRWIILLLDMVIVLISYAATVIADTYSLHIVTGPLNVLFVAAIVIGVYFVVSYISKS